MAETVDVIVKVPVGFRLISFFAPEDFPSTWDEWLIKGSANKAKAEVERVLKESLASREPITKDQMDVTDVKLTDIDVVNGTVDKVEEIEPEPKEG